MEIEVGQVIEIRRAANMLSREVTVTGIRLWVNGESIKSIITIDGGDGPITVGALHLARWVEKAERQYR